MKQDCQMKEFVLKKKLKDIIFKYTGMIRQKKIYNKSFSLISNNCWGGVIYRNFHIPYQSPTCGTFFMAPEYIKFIYDIKKYLNGNITEISIDQSKYKEYLINKKYDGFLGKIDDVEICFLHFNSFDEIKEKWKRRSERINWDRIIYKFNDQNLCSINELEAFEKFQAKNKICFTSKKYDGINSLQLEQYKDCDYVLSDTKERDYSRVLNIVNYINSI